MEDRKDGRVEGGKDGFRLCCLNARRIWASTPQIADCTENAENAERRGFRA